MSISFHAVTSHLMDVFDKAEVQGTAAVLIALEFCKSGLGSIGAIKSDYTSTPGPTAWLILYLGLFNLANGSEQIHKIVIAR